MKKLFILAGFILFAGFLFLVSCTKDNTTTEQKPVINFLVEQGFIYQDATMPVNSPVQMKVHAESNATSGAKLISMRVTRIFNLNSLDTTYTFSETSVNFTFTTTANSAVGQEKFEFLVTDKDGQSAKVGLIITTTATGSDVTSTPNITLGSYNDVIGSFFATSTGLAYTINDASQHQGIIDFCFFLGATNGSTIASPFDSDAQTVYAISGWTTKNDTRFIFPASISATDFDNIGATYAFPAFDDANSTTSAKHLAADNVIYFKTVLGKRGFIKVDAINPKGDKIVIDIKYEK
jgi:hypothetical protein